jgi:hypothetical protein
MTINNLEDRMYTMAEVKNLIFQERMKCLEEEMVRLNASNVEVQRTKERLFTKGLKED